jgi:hypothetical protein
VDVTLLLLLRWVGVTMSCDSMHFFGAYASNHEPPWIFNLSNSHHSGLRALIMVHQYVHASDLSSCLHDMLFLENRHDITVVGTQLTVPAVTWAGSCFNSPLLFNRLHNDK